MPTDIDGALITNEDGLNTEDFNYYTAIYEGENTSNSFAVTRKFDSNTPKVGTSGVIEMNVDLKYVSGSETQFMASSAITIGSPP